MPEDLIFQCSCFPACMQIRGLCPILPLPQLHSIHAAAISDLISNDLVDLFGVPSEYHDYADVFSKKKANTLVLHWPFDLKIELEEGTEPPIGRLYSLSPSEQGSLQYFLDEHLTNGFIHQSSSPHAAPVLFVQKTGGSLHLPIPLTSSKHLVGQRSAPNSISSIYTIWSILPKVMNGRPPSTSATAPLNG